MKNAPNSRVNLDRAIQRFAGDVAREKELRNLMANAIVAQMVGDGELFSFLAIPKPSPIPAMRLEYQIAQKLHGASAPSSKRAHDLIDLQLITANAAVDLRRTSDLCRKLFRYRKVHAWPPTIVKGDTWEASYNEQKGDLPVLPTVDEAVKWANELIARIDGIFSSKTQQPD